MLPAFSTFNLVLLLYVGAASAQTQSESTLWTRTYGNRDDMSFSGITTFAHLPTLPCLTSQDPFDIAIVGYPFDTSVTYRPGARFGPYGIRSGSRRLRSSNGWSMHWKMNPYDGSTRIFDCGDVPLTPYDNSLALEEMEVAYDTLLARPTLGGRTDMVLPRGHQGISHPFIVTLGGDHTIVYPILRSLYKRHGCITVLHFDSHIDTWPPYKVPSSTSSISQITHGTYFWKAAQEGLIANNSVHAGIRSKFDGPRDLEHDRGIGFDLISADDIDEFGVTGIVQRIRERVGDSPLYVSLDIDVLDPAFAPGTGTPEPGGWTSRELKRLLQGLRGLNFVGADVVEVAPAYDHADITGIAAADVVHEYLSLFIVGQGGRGGESLPEEKAEVSGGRRDEL